MALLNVHVVERLCMGICLFVCEHYSKSYVWIAMTFYDGVQSSKRKNWLNFGGDLGLLRCVNEQNNSIIVAACLKWGPGNDPEALELDFHQGPTFINAYFQAATNLVDWDSGVSNDLPLPRRSALSKCFV